MANTGPDDRGFTADDLFEEAEEDARQREEQRAADDPEAAARATLRGLLRPVALEWLTNEPPPRAYLLHWIDGRTGEAEGLFPRGRVGLLAAPGGVGKSFALIDLAVAVATGGDWLDAFPTDPEHAGGRVLLAMGEEDESEIRRRLWAAMEARGLDHEERRAVAGRVTVLPLAGTPCALTRAEKEGNDARTAFAAALEAELREAVAAEPDGWSCLLLDPVSRFAGPDAETDNAAATRFVQALEGMTKLPGSPSILAAVHTNKGSRKPGHEGATNAEAVRGSSGFVDGARWVAAMTPAANADGTADPDRVWLGVAKSNYGKRPGVPWLVRRSAGGALVAVEPEERVAALEDERRNAHQGAEGGSLTRDQRNERAANANINALTNRLSELRKWLTYAAELGEAGEPIRQDVAKRVAETLRQIEREEGKGRGARTPAPAPSVDDLP